MSFLTCFWDFPQKEHFSRSPPSPIRATYVLPALIGRLVPAPGLRMIFLVAEQRPTNSAPAESSALQVHRLPTCVTEVAGSTLPAMRPFSDPPKRACQGSVSLACAKPTPDT